MSIIAADKFLLIVTFLSVSMSIINTKLFRQFVCANNQCDQIWRFMGLWATFKSLWQQIIWPNLSHSEAIFVKVLKSIIFHVKSFLGNFYRHLAIFFWSHCQ